MTGKMRIFITSINSPIGSYLASHFKAKGFEIFGCSRAPKLKKALESSVDRYFNLYLNQHINTGIFKGTDILIHGAHSYSGRDNVHLNVNGTKKWFVSAKSSGVKTQVFLTSYSAKPESQSEYGRTKYKLETFFIQEKQTVIRPGLVIGKSGIFANMVKMVNKYPIIPLLDGGNYEFPIISIETLGAVIEKIILDPAPKVFNIFQEKMVSLKAVLKEIREQLNATCLFFPVPSFLPFYFLKSLETLKLPVPLKSERIMALKENQEIRRTSCLPELNIKDKPLKDIIYQLIRSEI